MAAPFCRSVLDRSHFCRSQDRRSDQSAGWAFGLLLGWIGVAVVVSSNKNPQAAGQDAALTAKERAIRQFEAELRLAELNARKVALASTVFSGRSDESGTTCRGPFS